MLEQVREPVVLHWLGEVFDPHLRGYWGSADVDAATATFLDLVRAHADKVDGVKVSLLSADHELGPARRAARGRAPLHRRRLQLPRADPGRRHAPLRRPARRLRRHRARRAAALAALDEGDLATYDAEMAPTLPLSRHVFEAPTYHYKTGIAFLSWLSGHQPGFTMVGGLQSARSAVHLGRLFELADDARLLPDPDLAAHRLGVWLEGAGITR